MEDLLDTEQQESGLVLALKSKKDLTVVRKWAAFFSILGLISAGFMVLAGFGMFFSAGSLPIGASPIDLGMMGVVYLVLAVLYVFPCISLYRFSDRMNSALRNDSSVDLTAAFNYLKVHFRFMGVMTVVIIALYVILIVGVIAFGASDLLGL